MKKKKILIRIFVFLFLLCIPAKSGIAASDLKLQYDGNTIIYRDKQVKYQLDGKTISLGKAPGIIINQYSLVSYKEVFEKAIGANCNYDTAGGTITIKKFNNTVKLTLGSRTAYVNGVKRTIPIAPRKVRYIAANTTKIAVPARFVTEALGYTYHWYKESSTVKITSPYQICYDSKWYLYTGAKGQVSVNGKNIDLAGNPALVLDNTAMAFAKKVFQSKEMNASYQYDSKTKKVTISKDKTTVIFTLGSKTATVNGKKHTLTTAPRTIRNNETKVNCIMVPIGFTAEALGYAYKWDTNTQTAIITTKKPVETNNGNENQTGSEEEGKTNNSGNTNTSGQGKETIIKKWESQESNIIDGYSNLISSLALGTNGKEQTKGTVNTLTLTGSIPVSANITSPEDSPNTLYVDLPGMQNTLGEILYIPPDNTMIQNISVITMSDFSTRIEIEKADQVEYYSSITGNEYKLHFGSEAALTPTEKPNVTPTDKPSAGSNSSTADGNYAIRIVMPDGVGLEQITDADLYHSNRIVLTIPGDQTAFFNLNPIEKRKDNIKSTTYALNSKGNTDITITTTKLQGYQLKEEKGFICVYVDNPSKIYAKIVALDPGHGGSAPGTISATGVKEKDVTLAILYKYALPYFNAPNSTIKAYWIRTDDSNPSFEDRAKFAQKTEADLFISLHMNSATASANGTETYYSTDNNQTGTSSLNSKLLAEHFQSKLPGLLGLNGKRGVKTAGFYVIKNNSVPAILIELGFFTNAVDFSKLVDPDFQNKAASSIYLLTEELFTQYPPVR